MLYEVEGQKVFDVLDMPDSMLPCNTLRFPKLGKIVYVLGSHDDIHAVPCMALEFQPYISWDNDEILEKVKSIPVKYNRLVDMDGGYLGRATEENIFRK